MTKHDMERIVNDFASAAVIAYQAGLDPPSPSLH